MKLVGMVLLMWLSPPDTAIVSPMDELFSLWDIYALECYNDSTRHEGWVFRSAGGSAGNLAGWDEWEVWYSHPEPTFRGFRDWYRKRRLEQGDECP